MDRRVRMVWERHRDLEGYETGMNEAMFKEVMK